MCLCTVWVDVGGESSVVMQDVAVMTAEEDGYVLIDLFGTRKIVRGSIKALDFVDEHTVLIEGDAPA